MGSGGTEAQTWALRKRAGYRGIQGARVLVSSVRLTPSWFWALLAPEPLGGAPAVLIALREPGRQLVTGGTEAGLRETPGNLCSPGGEAGAAAARCPLVILGDPAQGRPHRRVGPPGMNLEENPQGFLLPVPGDPAKTREPIKGPVWPPIGLGLQEAGSMWGRLRALRKQAPGRIPVPSATLRHSPAWDLLTAWLALSMPQPASHTRAPARPTPAPPGPLPLPPGAGGDSVCLSSEWTLWGGIRLTDRKA